MTSKPCSQCREDKPLDAFNAHPGARDGLQSQCRDCQVVEKQKVRDLKASLHDEGEDICYGCGDLKQVYTCDAHTAHPTCWNCIKVLAGLSEDAD